MLKLRRSLRKRMPEPEARLWQSIRNRQLNNLKFRRQHSVGPFVVDFYCAEHAVAVEIDGDSHFRNEQVILADNKRQEYIESQQIKVIRFTNNEVMNNLEGVLQSIITLTLPSPFKGEEV